MEVRKAEPPDPAVQKNGKDVRADATDNDRESTRAHDNLAPVREMAYQPGSAAKVEVTGPTEAQAHLPQFADVPAPGTLDRPGRPPESAAETAKAKDTADKLQIGAEVSPEGQALLALAEKKINVPGYPHAAKELELFKANITKFEKEAKEGGLSDQEKRETYKGIDRLLNSTGRDAQGVSSGVHSERQRVRIAEQLMDMVARPEDRSQGSFSTCALASIEGLLLTGKDREPSKVTGMVADLALTGHTNVRGIDVKLDRQSLQSFGEHAENRAPGEDKQRLAENIFRVAAANVYFGIMKNEGKPEGQLQYVSRQDGNYLKYVPDTTGQLVHSKELAKLNQTQYREESAGSASSMTGESRILSQITGKDYSDRIIINSEIKGEDAKYVTKLGSEKELAEHIKDLEKQGRLPAAMGVYAGHEALAGAGNPFDGLGDMKTAADAQKVFSNLFADEHSMLVTGTKQFADLTMFSMKNTWGEKSNIDVSSAVLFDITKPVDPNIMLDSLQQWHKEHPDNGSKDLRSKYDAGITAGAFYVVGRYGELAADASPQTRQAYEAAGHRAKEMLDTMSVDDKVELAKVIAKLEKASENDPGVEQIYRLYSKLIK